MAAAWFTALEEIHGRFGFLTPQVVLDEARDEASALHSHFEWDDAAAGEHFRLVQAQRLIRKAKILVAISPDEPAERVRAFVSVQPPGSSGPVYKDLNEVMASTDLRESLVRKAQQDVAVLRRRWRQYSSLAVSFAQILREAAAELEREAS